MVKDMENKLLSYVSLSFRFCSPLFTIDGGGVLLDGPACQEQPAEIEWDLIPGYDPKMGKRSAWRFEQKASDLYSAPPQLR